MSKSRFALIGAVIVIALSSCQKEPQTTVIHTTDTVVRTIETIVETGGFDMKVHYYTVQPAQWLSNADLDYMYASFEDSDITRDVIENGCVIAYFVDADERDNPMPCEVYRSWDNNGTIVYYAETFTFDVEQGVITFKFQSSDFDNETSISQYGNLVFKVCVLIPPAQ